LRRNFGRNLLRSTGAEADVIEECEIKMASILSSAVGPEVRQSIFALLLGMHAAIEDNSLLPRFEIVTVGADLGPTRQVNELQEERQLAHSLPRDQTTNSPPRRCPRAVMVLIHLFSFFPNALLKELRFSLDPRPAPINYSP
jgi:hypothetical protein